MTSWLAREAYSPILVLIAGLLTYAGALGAGRLLLRLTRVQLPFVWETVCAALLGLQVMSLGVLVLGMASVATRTALVAWMLTLWVTGLIELPRLFHSARRAWPAREPVFYWVACSLIALSLAVNLTISIAPSTKLDELYYHMLVPSRLVSDHALHFYLLPWEGAAVPQMGFQIAAAPLHAASLPDAANVVSWALSATMVWFFYRLLRDTGHVRSWAAGWCATLVVGLYGAVLYVTGGSQAMGDLAVAALLLAAIIPELLTRDVSDASYAVAVGMLASAGMMTKASTIPVVIASSVFCLVRLCRRKSARCALRFCALAILPTVVLWLPSVVWTWYASGAPMGPFYSWWFPHSVYNSVRIRELMAPGATLTVTELVLKQSPLVWAAVVCALGTAVIMPGRRIFAGAVLLGQAILIAALLTRDTRFLSGIPLGLAMVFALAPPAWARRWGEKRVFRGLLLTVMVLPWAVAAVYYASPYARVVAGAESAEQFRDKYVSLYADYRALDLMLPANAVLLTDERISSVYAPRLPVWTVHDIPPGRPVYQVAKACADLDGSMSALDTVYYSPAAKLRVFRTPGRAPAVAPLCVRRLAPPSNRVRPR